MLFAGIGLALFTGITAYDTQKMRKLSEQCMEDTDMMNRISIYSAFQLYLDFVNIFLYILRIMGNRKYLKKHKKLILLFYFTPKYSAIFAC